MSNGFVSRFAPSPTGYLHLGHLVNAVYVWGITRRANGRLILRLEDHDRTRCRPEYDAAIVEDLAGLGLEADVVYRQGEHEERYERALAQLAASGLVYACDCSRKALRDRVGESVTDAVYDGYCRGRDLAWTGGRALRCVLEPEIIQFDDLLLGTQTQQPSLQCGDVVLRDGHGNWTYQFAVVVDDVAEQVSHAIRGADLLGSTGRQLQLMQLLGHPAPPQYLHHGLLVDSGGRKLSKRDFDTPLREARLAGVAPGYLLGEAAWRAGLITERRDLNPRELAALFSGEDHRAISAL